VVKEMCPEKLLRLSVFNTISFQEMFISLPMMLIGICSCGSTNSVAQLRMPQINFWIYFFKKNTARQALELNQVMILPHLD